VVQVAALSDAGKAKQMQESIAAAGVKAYTEVVPIVKGQVTRVRAGPFASRDEAEKVREKLKGMGLNGNVVAK
jgi:DedD protein